MNKQGEFIRKARRKNGLTQKQLAEMLNINDKVISSWELGEGLPYYNLLPRLADILKVDIQEILDGEYHRNEKVNTNNNFRVSKKNSAKNYIVSSTSINTGKQSVGSEEALNKILGLESKPLINNLKCSNCGSCDFTIGNGYATCNNCGAKIITDKKITNNFITNVSLKNENTQNHFIVDTLVTEKDFRKNVYYFLTIHPTPSDILNNIVFARVNKNDAKFLAIDAQYEGNYSASIGYDKKEQYMEKEKVYVPEINNYVEKNVVKERTIIDWHPVSGPVSLLQKSCVQLGIQGSDLLDEFSDELANDIDHLQAQGSVKPIDSQNSKDINFRVPTTVEINKAISSGEYAVYSKTKSSLYGTGDHMKDFDCRLNHTIENQNFYVATEYSVEYVYKSNEEKNDFEGMLWGLGYKNKIIGLYPNATKDITEEIKEQTKGSGIISIILSALTILLCILSFVLLRRRICMIFIGVMLAITTISFIFYRKDYKNTKKQINTELIDTKKEKLISILQEEGLPELTEAELNEIEKMKEELWYYAESK